jgi:PAS domain S-box-containing protein
MSIIPPYFAMTRWQTIITATALSLAIILTAYFYYSVESKSLHEIKQREIKSIAELKIEQLSQWHMERMADTRVISKSPFFAEAVLDWIAHPADHLLLEKLRKRLVLPKEEYKYEDIFISTPSGKLLLSLDSHIDTLDSTTISFIQKSAVDNKIVESDFYYCPTHKKIHYDILAPIQSENKRIVAVLIFRIDPGEYLYPFIQEWPIPTTTSETLILRIDGDSIVYLNKLRYADNSLLNHRISLSSQNNPGVQAYGGKSGIIDGYDYRGVHVLAYVAPVPHSQWLLETKIDHQEIYSELVYRATITIILTILSILMVSAGLALFYRSRQKSIYKELFLKEKELREQHEEFRTILYSIGDGVITTDLNGRVKKMNHAAATLSGWDELSAMGMKIDDVLPFVNEFSRQPVINPVSVVLHHGATVGLANHTVLISKNGKEIPIADSASPIRNKNGEIEGAVLVFRDKSEEHESELKIRKSEEKYRIVADNTFDWEFWMNPEGRFVYNSPACKRTTGYESEMFIENPKLFMEIIHHDDRQNVEQHWQEYDLQQRSGKIGFRIIHADGELKWIEHVCNPVFDINGIFMGSRGSNRDVTDRMHVEEALIASEKYLKETQIIAELGTYKTDIVTGTWESSEIMDKIFGIDVDYDKSVAGWGALIHPEWRQTMVDYFIQEVVGKKIKFDKEYKIIRQSDGVARWVHGIGELKLNENGDPITMIGTIMDITDRKDSEANLRRIEERLRQSEKMEAVGQLAGGIAHDFNNVLGGIIGFTDLSLNLVDKDSILEKNLQKVLTAAERAKQLVKQILAFSRQSNPQKVVTSLRPITKEVIELLKSSIPSSVIIVAELPKDTSPVMADPTQIHQAVLNLATNAVHAMNRKGTLTIKLYRQFLTDGEHGLSGSMHPGEYTVIEVSDTGCGMDTTTLSRAFEPFFTTKGVGEGTGMGLSVVLGVVQSHHGDILVRSELGKGTTIRLFLPAAEDAEELSHNKTITAAISGHERILFVDDEPSLVDLAVNILPPLGFTVHGFLKSVEALAFYADHRSEIDLLITDQTMPEMTGLELIAKIHEIEPDLPVILCTGYSNEVDIEKTGTLGIQRLVMKPYGAYEISKSVRDVLDKLER